MINQQWLHTFLTLVEVGHFTHTAEKLYMTQPGVSQQIKKLEEQVGVALLNRVGKRFELTREGETLYRFGCQRRQEDNNCSVSYNLMTNTKGNAGSPVPGRWQPFSIRTY